MLGLPPPVKFGHFDVIDLDNSVSMDFAEARPGMTPAITPQHYAFLIGEADFDAVLGRALAGVCRGAALSPDQAGFRLFRSRTWLNLRGPHRIHRPPPRQMPLEAPRKGARAPRRGSRLGYYQ